MGVFSGSERCGIVRTSPTSDNPAVSFTFDFDPPTPPKPARPAAERDIYTVSRLNKEVRLLLESGLPMLWLEGEISNFAAPASGHWYFSLKDSTAQVRCAMWRQRNSTVRFRPKDGMAVLVRARVGLYEPRGEYQLLVEHLEEAGEGALKREFEKLKARLAAEGLFAAERKRPLPATHRSGFLTHRRGHSRHIESAARTLSGGRCAAVSHRSPGRGGGPGNRAGHRDGIAPQ